MQKIGMGEIAYLDKEHGCCKLNMLSGGGINKVTYMHIYAGMQTTRFKDLNTRKILKLIAALILNEFHLHYC